MSFSIFAENRFPSLVSQRARACITFLRNDRAYVIILQRVRIIFQTIRTSNLHSHIFAIFSMQIFPDILSSIRARRPLFISPKRHSTLYTTYTSAVYFTTKKKEEKDTLQIDLGEIEVHDGAESILSKRTKTWWQSAYYVPAGAIASIRPTFFIFAVSPGRKITTSFPRSNSAEWRRSRVSVATSVSRSLSLSSFVYVCVRYTVARARA